MFRNTRVNEMLGVADCRPFNVTQDRYDSTLYKELEGTSQLEHLAGGDETFKALLQDVWATYYKAEPTLAEHVDPLYKANRPLVQRLHEDTETQQVRLTTQLDELGSALATLATGQALKQEIHSRKDLRVAQEKLLHAQQEMQVGTQAKAEQLAGEAQQIFEGQAVAVRRAVRQAIKEGQEQATNAMGTLAGWGLQPGDLATLPMGERLELVQRLQGPKMARMTALVGRMKNLARAKQRGKVKKGRDEIHSITVGNELQHLLPAELAALNHPARRLDFMRRYTEGQLLQYDLKSKEPQGRGPMVVLVDVSGSMSGQRIEWAIATALALVDTAQRQKRHAAVVFFNTQVMGQHHFKPHEKDAEKLAAVATMGVSGGTDYWPAFLVGLALIKEKHFEAADLVVITDGCCDINTEQEQILTAAKGQHKFKVCALIVGAQAYPSVNQWADKLWQLPDLQDETATEQLFEEVY